MSEEAQEVQVQTVSEVAAVVQETAAVIQRPTAEQLAAMSKEDILKLKTDIQDFANTAIAEVEAAVLAKEQELAGEVKTWAEQFREKNGVSVQVALIGAAFILFEVVPAIFRVLK